MPVLSPQQATAAFAKYQVQSPGDNTTTQEIFASWLEADDGAFEKYVNDNGEFTPSQSLEEFKSSGGTKQTSQEAASWNTILEKLSPQALEIIRLCAYLNPDNVPRSLLEQMIPEDLRAKVLSELCSQSLLIDADVEGQLFNIQRPLQETVRQQLAKQDNARTIAKAVVEKAVEALKVTIGSHEIASTLDLCLFWKTRDYLNLQIELLIVEGEKLKVSDALLATLLEWAGEYKQCITMNLTESLNLHQRSLTLKKAAYGDNHPDIAMSLFNIGEISCDLDQHDKALEYYQQALEMRQVVYGDKHPSFGASLDSIGFMYRAQGQYDKALKYFQQALAIYKTAYGDKHQRISSSLNNIGMIYCDLNQYDQALEYCQQALVINKAFLGDKHPNVAESLRGIGYVYAAKKQYNKALEYYQQMLAIYKAIFGDNHIYIAQSLYGVGSIYESMSQNDEAFRYYQQALANMRAVFGDKHKNVAALGTKVDEMHKIILQKKAHLEVFLVRIEAKDENLKEVNLYDFGKKEGLHGVRLNDADLRLLAQALSQSQVTSLNLGQNHIGNAGTQSLAQVLAQTQLTSLNLMRNKIATEGATALAKSLPQSQVTSLDLWGNNIGDAGAAALAEVLERSKVTNLDLGDNGIGVEGATALAKALPRSQVTSLYLGHNNIGDAGAVSLAAVLPQSQIAILNLKRNSIGGMGMVALSKAVKLSYIIETCYLDRLSIEEERLLDASELVPPYTRSSHLEAIFLAKHETPESKLLENHLAINKLLNAKKPENKTVGEFIQELENSALMYINQPQLLDDAAFEKPKRLLLKALEFGSVQATYLLANLYVNELKDLTKAKEHYLKAASMGHVISKLCLEIIQRIDAPTKLELGSLTIKLPRRFSLNTIEQKLILRNDEVINLSEPNTLVSKTGLSLSAINELQTIYAAMDVCVATKDYEPIESGHLHFNQGQTIYVNNFYRDVAKSFAGVAEGGLPSFILYNKDKLGRKRADEGIIPYDMYLSKTYFRIKSREDWSAEEVCNAIITPKTKPKVGEKAKPYVDILPTSQRGKPFEGYILSYARSTKFIDILRSLNERFRERNPAEVFIWIDLAGINQHAWMEMKSEDIGKILEVNLTQLFTYASEGRLIHFDKARPTNLTRSWCLVELLSCLKAQENTVAQTEICMSSNVQAEVLAQDLIGLLDSLDSSKAECFNPTDKIAIDTQIKKALTNEGEIEISMEEAYARLNTVVKSWLVTKFLPDFSNIQELKEQAHVKDEPNSSQNNPQLTFAFETSKASAVAMQKQSVNQATKSHDEGNKLGKNKLKTKANCVIS